MMHHDGIDVTEQYMSLTSGGNAAFRNWHNDFVHVKDPNERRRLALAEVDKAKFGWYHIRTIAVAGAGFFTDSYDLFAINLVSVQLGLVYWDNGKIPGGADTALKLSASIGTIIGQVLFGWFADQLGRKRMYGFELLIIIIGTLAQALSSNSPSMSVVGTACFWRVIMGIGIGGDYPLSSVITSEFATTRWRGAMMAAVFSLQGLGQLGAALVTLVVTIAFRRVTSRAESADQCDFECKVAVDRMWRIIVSFGVLPGLVALYYRLTIPETPRYTFDVDRDTLKGEADAEAFLGGRSEGMVDQVARAVARERDSVDIVTPRATWAEFKSHFSQWKYLKIIVGTAGSWFVLDVAFYGIGLNNSIILKAIGYSNEGNVYKTLYNNAVGNIILICAGALPGYWLTIATVDTIGRKTIQLAGFAMLTVMFTVIGFSFNKLPHPTLFGLYIITQFFFNFGPNATTFIIPGEAFPTRYRSTAHGVSAACGKLGAVVAQLLIGPLRSRGSKPGDDSPWLNHVMQIFAIFMLAGIGLSLLVPETKKKTLEELCAKLHGDLNGFQPAGSSGSSSSAAGLFRGAEGLKLQERRKHDSTKTERTEEV